MEMEGDNTCSAYMGWTDLCVHMRANRGYPPRPILLNTTGYAEPGSILAIMGPSGSGKSTLLDALAGRLAPNAILTGDIMLNGQSKPTGLSFGSTAAYVTQEDVLIGTLTVRESVMYSASLRLPDTSTTEQKREIVDSAIREMGLCGCQHTCVGTSLARGLSGGEKRRLSIALQILTRPRLLFLDEPTSGLDSAAAYFVVHTLRKLAKDGRTVISSIHQPCSEVFALFSHLTLLSSGRTLFFGEAASASQFFAASNYPCPPMRNPSDHFLQIINADFDMVKTTLIGLQVDDDVETADPLLLKSGEDAEKAVKALLAAYQRSEYAIATRLKTTQFLSISLLQSGERGVGSKGHASFRRQCMTLTKRSFVNMARNPGYYWIRLAIFLVIGFCVGTIFWRVGLQYNSIKVRGGVMIFAAGGLTFMAICGFPAFVEDMKVFHHERLNEHYGVAAFVIGNTCASIPFLFLIALLTGTLIYIMVELHSGFGHYAFFILVLFTASMCVESLMMAISSVVGRNFLLGIVIGAGIQSIYILVAGYYRMIKDIPKPMWRYPVSYLSFHTYVLQGLFKNDFLGLTFKSFLGEDGKPIGPDLPGAVALEQMFGVDSSHGKWGDLSIVFAMIAVYRILFFVLIKLRENLGPRLRVTAWEYFSVHDREVEMKAVLRTGS